VSAYGAWEMPTGSEDESGLNRLAEGPRMDTIAQCDCGAEYKRTETKFLVPHTGHASCKVCGATLESWSESTHVPAFELVKRPDRKPA
jgi:hypothetical protein